MRRNEHSYWKEQKEICEFKRVYEIDKDCISVKENGSSTVIVQRSHRVKHNEKLYCKRICCKLNYTR